jgi:NAD+ kinase
MSDSRVIVVTKRSVFSQALNGEGDPRVRQLFKKDDPSVRKWVNAHDQHTKTLDTVLDALAKLGVSPLVLRGAHAQFDPRGAKLVVAVGGDGTLLAASHSVRDVPILGVNSSPRHSVGFFCAARRAGIEKTLARALDGHMPSVNLARMRVTHNGQVRSQRVLNDALYCHASPAATSRYILRQGRAQEEQRSSGFWVGPAAGSTAAQRSAGGKVLPLTTKKLQLVVREPYMPTNRPMRLARLEVGARGSITVQSKMQDAGIYLDGPYQKIPVRLGDITVFEVSTEPLTVLGLSRNRERFTL